MEAFADVIVATLEGTALFVIPLAAWLLIRGAIATPPHPVYARPGWNFFLKRWWAQIVLWRHSRSRRQSALGIGLCCLKDPNNNMGPAGPLISTPLEEQLEGPRELKDFESEDNVCLWGHDARSGAMLFLHVNRNWRAVPSVWLLLRLSNESTFTLPPEGDEDRQRAAASRVVTASEKPWSARGLRLEMMEPLRRWRVRFDGLMRRNTENGVSDSDGKTASDVYEPVSFNFIWRAASNPVELQADWHPELLSEAMAREPWRNGKWPYMTGEWGEGYDQWGTLRGEVRVGGAAVSLHLRGLRRRRWGQRPALWLHRALALSAWAPNTGRRVALAAAASASGSGASHALWGHVHETTGEQVLVSDADLALPALTEHPDAPPEHFVVRLKAGKCNYSLDVYPLLHCAIRRLTSDGFLHLVAPFVCTYSNVQAQGVMEIWYRTEGQRWVPRVPRAPPTEDDMFEEEDEREESIEESFVLTFEDPLCRRPELVGGKGASLSAMRAVSHSQVQVRVPRGFCVTAAAFSRHLEEGWNVRWAVHAVRDTAPLAGNGCQEMRELKRVCERAERMLSETPLDPGVEEAVRGALDRLFAAEGHSVRLAVRSSALGEDSEELSAAGQNLTLLGLASADDVIKAIARCWASLFSFQSVEYRRQHGQIVDCGMGVVVQVMVAAEKAGVLFTHHPVTNAPHEILITANYGLGETVVSAQVEPDSIVVARDWNGTLSIAELSYGSKRVRMRMAEEGGTSTEALPVGSDAAQELCLSHEEILNLAELGLVIEAAFGSPRDIEWAIAEGKIYLLQSRPITSLDLWTDSELLHEFDSPICGDTDLNTFGNTGEVFPCVCSPLGLSIALPILDWGISNNLNIIPWRYNPQHLTISHNRILLNMLSTIYRTVEKKISIGFKVAEIAVFGHLVTTPEFHFYALERNGAHGTMGKVKTMLDGIKGSMWNTRAVKKAEILLSSIGVHRVKYTSSEILHLAISQTLKKIMEIGQCHSKTSQVSVFSQVIAMSILTESSEDLTTSHYSDIALLLSSCANIVSAEVPTDMKDLAESIIETGRGGEFCSLPTDLAVEWLEANTGEFSTKFKKFIKKHGHRGIMEFDVMSMTWGLDPQSIVATLQTMVEGQFGISGEREAPLSPEDTVSRLKSINHERTRSLLCLLLPWCRHTVAQRESTKASLIGAFHCVRLAYRHLAAMMVREGRLPDAELLFFLSHYELGKLIATRSPGLISKAQRRRRLWPQWDKLNFPEVIQGLPEPIQAAPKTSRVKGAGESEGDDATRIKGTPVWAGTAIGRACVVLHLSEITQLRRGDILITRSTDIGWSPYFPMLGGVVTELGGLISHGAVVAREYGLPCIVGAEGATDLFKTGDTVLLVGETGTLEVVDG